MSQQKWYALFTKPKAEYKVAAVLEQSGVEVYLPEICRKNSTETVHSPFFPCYLFMSANLQALDVALWKWASGLRNIVSYGDEPIHLSPELIHHIQVKIEKLNSQIHEMGKPTFKQGDSVRILHGPLKDMEAIFEGPTTPSKRVHVLLTILEQQRRIRLNVSDIEKSPSQDQHLGKRPRRTRGRGRRIKH